MTYVDEQRDRLKRTPVGAETLFESFEKRWRIWLAELDVPQSKKEELLKAGFLGVIGSVDGTYGRCLNTVILFWLVYCACYCSVLCKLTICYQCWVSSTRRSKNSITLALRSCMVGNCLSGFLIFARSFCTLRYIIHPLPVHVCIHVSLHIH